MIHKPATGEMWDPCMVWHEGTYYLFSMLDGHSMHTATSPDGVHWTARPPGIDRAPFGVFKMFIGRCGDRFILDHGSHSGRPGCWNDTLRFWESRDLLHWTYTGEARDLHPDPRWYRPEGRCDHMYIVRKIEGRPGAGFWGYCVASTNDAQPCKALGMLESDDGLDWRWLPPPAFDWGSAPEQLMEVGGCERIGGRYYMIQGARFDYLGHFGYSVFTFVADDPKGPFRPDPEAYRLCGTSHDLRQLGYGGKIGEIGVNCLASFARGDGELLLTNAIVSGWGGSEAVWFAPVRKAVVDARGHLRMGYWPGNEALKGAPIPLDLGRCRQIHPAAPKERHTVQAAGSRAELQDARGLFDRHGGGGTIALLDNTFDLERGFILEGRLTLRDTSEGEPTHRIPVSGGFYFEDAAGHGKAILLETYGITRIDRVDLREGRLACAREDTTGPGCATVGGAVEGRRHAFRLLVRRDMFELYLDDQLVQSFLIAPHSSGRVGFVVEDGACVVEDVKAWAMNL